MMLDKKEQEKLEAEHAKKLNEFKLQEEELDRYYYKFEKYTEELLANISLACRNIPLDVVAPHIYQIEDNLADYKKNYQKKMDDILEQRYQENRQYYDKLEESN